MQVAVVYRGVMKFDSIHGLTQAAIVKFILNGRRVVLYAAWMLEGRAICAHVRVSTTRTGSMLCSNLSIIVVGQLGLEDKRWRVTTLHLSVCVSYCVYCVSLYGGFLPVIYQLYI